MKKQLIAIVLLLAGCKEKYIPDFTTPVTGYLVVEGVITTGPDSTYIELSRTNQVGNTQKQLETGASLQVEGDNNSTFSLDELPSAAGRYGAALNLSTSVQYRLRIRTQAGKEYLSDFAGVKNTPPIDSIGWQRENGGVQLYINTHDPQNNTHYYLWDYKETWEFHSPYRSLLEYKYTPVTGGGTVLTGIGYRDPADVVRDTALRKCWRSFASDQLLLGSSARLSEDVIYKPLLYVAPADKKMSVLYSVELRQYALTKPGYEFLEKMKKNTEAGGSIFDAQPSQLKGNIYCVTDPAEPVIGYVNIASLQRKRLFISNTELARWDYRTDCEEVKILNSPDSIEDAARSGYLPTTVLELAGNSIVYFGITSPPCIDCTLTGTNVKPPFWP